MSNYYIWQSKPELKFKCIFHLQLEVVRKFKTWSFRSMLKDEIKDNAFNNQIQKEYCCELSKPALDTSMTPRIPRPTVYNPFTWLSQWRVLEISIYFIMSNFTLGYIFKLLKLNKMLQCSSRQISIIWKLFMYCEKLSNGQFSTTIPSKLLFNYIDFDSFI